MGSQHLALADLPPGKTRYPLYRRLGGPRGRSGRSRKISPPTEFNPRTVQPVASCYTNYAIPPPVNAWTGTHLLLIYLYQFFVGRDSVAGIVTRYRLDGPGIESRWGQDFQHTSRPVLWSTQPPIQWVPSLFPGWKRPGRCVDHPLLSSAEVKWRAELYLYSLSGPSWSVLVWT
jgi:hypothetical protein